MKDFKDNLVMEFYSNLSSELLNLSHSFFERKYASKDHLNLKIHNYFYDLIQGQEEDSIDKFNLYSYLYPNQAFNESKLSTALNRHLPDLKEFAILAELKNDNDFVEVIWTDFLVDLKYNMKRKENIELNKNVVRPISFYFNSRENYYYNIKFNELIKSFESGELLKQYIDDFESYAAFTKMQLYIGLIVQYLHLKEFQNIDKLKMELGDSFSKYLNNTNFHICSNAQILRLYLNFNEDLFDLLFNNVLENLIKLSDENKIFYLNNLFNFIIIQFTDGREHIKLKEYELYIKLEELDLLHIQGSITYRKLINIVYACLYNSDQDQARHFLEKYHLKLPNEIQTSSYSFNMARILFAQADYANALRELNKVDFSYSIYYTVYSKKLELQAFISLGQYDVALN